MKIETCRMCLRPWRDEDAPALYRYASDPRVGPIAGWPVHTGVENSREIIRGVLSEPETYAVVLKESGEPVGSAGIMLPGHGNLPMEPGGGRDRLLDRRALLGTRPDPGGGRGTAEAMLHGAGLPEVWCVNFEGNQRSERVQEKCGFIYQRTIIGEPNPYCGIAASRVSCLTRAGGRRDRNDPDRLRG